MVHRINRLLYLMTLLHITNAAAQTPVYDVEQLQRSGISFSVAPYVQGSSDIDGGGSYSISSLLMRIGYIRPVSNQVFMGLGFSYDITNYDFDDLSAFNGQQPWSDVHNFNLSVPIIFQQDRHWTFLASPSIGTFREVGAEWKDSLAYGAVLIGSYSNERGNRLGLGLGAYNRLDKSVFFPFLTVKWQLTDKWRIGNALNAGPTGPSGLQLAYRFAEKWEAAIGFGRRSFRFRLDDTGIAPGGIGTQKGRLLFLRLSTDLSRSMHLDINAGFNHDGSLTLESNEDVIIASSDHDTAPLLALNLSGRF
jgi:hypothetical protein